MLSANERLADQGGRKPTGAHLGKMLRGMITGKWDDADLERRYLAQSGGVNTQGGYLVPEQLSAEILDLARAQSVLFRAGCRTVEMETDSLIMAKQTADATYYNVGENQSITESELTFGAVTFTAKKIAALIRCSNELLQDAPNAADAIQTALTNGLAVNLDRLALVGNGGSDGILGLTGNANITAVAAGGAISWEKLNEAATGVWAANYTPNAYILHPTIYSDATMLTTGDGATAAKGWLPAPPIVARLTDLQTTAITTALGLVGRFTECAWGVRLQADVQMSPIADTAFSKFQTLIRCVFRGDFQALQTAAFHRLSGITT
jgi:HK97 family phage major capsid protein